MMTLTESDRLVGKLPHQGAMRLVDSVIRVDERSVETSVRIDSKRAALFGDGKKIEPYVGIELIAQSAAMPLIYTAEDGKEHAGMIAQVRSFHSFGAVLEDCPTLITRCDVELMLDGRVASVKGTVFNGESKVCEAVITLAILRD